MRSFHRSLVLLAALILMAGCQKRFEHEKAFTLTAGEIQADRIDPPSREQHVSVTVTATGSPVNVHIVPESAHAETMRAMQDMKKIDPSKVLASKDKVASDTIEVTIPAKTGFSVFFSGAKKQAEVKLRIVGK